VLERSLQHSHRVLQQDLNRGVIALQRLINMLMGSVVLTPAEYDHLLRAAFSRNVGGGGSSSDGSGVGAGAGAAAGAVPACECGSASACGLSGGWQRCRCARTRGRDSVSVEDSE